MSVSKEASLAALYRRMERAEIEQRLARGDLTEIAASTARAELAQRDQAAAAALARPAWRVGLGIVAGSFITGGLAYWIMPKEIFWLIAVSLLPGLAMVIGKTLPILSHFAGSILVATPLWLGFWMHHSGALKWQGGDYRPLGTLIAWGALIALSFFGIVVGSNLLRGARHTGSWQELEEEIEEQRKTAMEDIRRAD